MVAAPGMRTSGIGHRQVLALMVSNLPSSVNISAGGASTIGPFVFEEWRWHEPMALTAVTVQVMVGATIG